MREWMAVWTIRPLSSVIEIDTEEVCPAFVGTVTYNHTIEGSYVRSDGRLEVLSRQTNVVMDIALDYHEDHSSSPNNFVVTSGTVRWSNNNSTAIHDVYCGSVGKDEYGIQETRVFGGGSWFHFNFFIMDTIISEIEDEDRLIDGWRQERLHHGSVTEIRTLDWDLRRYTSE